MKTLLTKFIAWVSGHEHHYGILYETEDGQFAQCCYECGKVKRTAVMLKRAI